MSFQDYIENLYWQLSLRMLSDSDKSLLRKIWENMLKARIFEEKILALRAEGKISKFWLFSGIGQEAGQAVITTFLEEEDCLLPAYRGFAPVISRGFPLARLAAEVLSKNEGPEQGRGAPASFYASDYGIYRHSDILGLDFGTAVGLGLGLKRRKKGIAAVFFGDGAASRGPLWSALNLSALWKLPILWVCENNQYSLSTHGSKLSAASFAARASSFGLSAEAVDGNDTIQIFFALKRILQKLRLKSQPAFIELKTYRVVSHDLFFLTEQWYQSQDERQHWLRRDPLVIAEQKLVASGLISDDEIAAARQKIKVEVDAAFTDAEGQVELTKEELLSQEMDL